MANYERQQNIAKDVPAMIRVQNYWNYRYRIIKVQILHDYTYIGYRYARCKIEEISQ
jgi:hypothetical protein